MTCSCRISEFGGLITRNNEDLGSEIAIKTTRSSHVECVCQLVKKSVEGKKAEGKKEAVCNMGRRINYREEEIPDCGCIYR